MAAVVLEGQRQGNRGGAAATATTCRSAATACARRSPACPTRRRRNVKIRRGAVIRVAKTPKGAWEMAQLPEVEGAFVGLDPRDGAIRALVGGFDFGKNKFNHVTQAWRQPGSSFKPFIYSAALEKGFTPATVVNDAPLFFDAGTTGGQPWEPKNYDGNFEGPMTLRTRAGEVEEHGDDPRPAIHRHPLRAGLDRAASASTRDKQPRLPADGAGRRLGHAACRWPPPTRCSPMAATASIPTW